MQTAAWLHHCRPYSVLPDAFARVPHWALPAPVFNSPPPIFARPVFGVAEAASVLVSINSYVHAADAFAGCTDEIPLYDTASTTSVCDYHTNGQKRRRTACKNCTRRDDCGTCVNCSDKPRFGGRGVRKQACIQKTCTCAHVVVT